MVILQDWWSDEGIRGPIDKDSVELGYGTTGETNKNLIALLRKHFGLSLDQTYATNLFPLIKIGAKNAQIPQKDMIRAAREFALPQIQIVEPLIAIALSVPTFNALRVACRLPQIPNLEEGISSAFRYGKTKIWFQAHTGRLGRNNRNRGGVDRVSRDWYRMAQDFKNSGVIP